MVDKLDFADDPRLTKKFDYLSALFSRFNFPSRPHHYASQLEIDYWNVVRDLDAIDPPKLDDIAKDCSEVFELRELELRFSMEVEDVESESWLKEFIRRLDVAKQESTDSLASAFSSQTELSQEVAAPPVQAFQRTISSTTTLGESQPERLTPPETRASPPSFESPSSSMQLLALNSPKKRKLDKTPAERANNFLDRLRITPPRPYEYGILPFAVDWQVCRLDSDLSLNLEDAKTWQHEQLAPHADSPRIIWERLIERAQQTAVADVDDIRIIPDQTSTRVYETLAEKGWKDGHIHLALKMQIVDRKPISYTIQPMKYSSSRRAYRKFGSDRFITLGIPQPAYQNRLADVHRFLSSPLLICGRTYQLFFVKVAKDTCSAHYFATEGAGLEPWSRNALMQWLISLEKNKESLAAKLWSRISLSLSSTTPSVVFAPHEIQVVDDITSPTNECMTDGCAKASPAVFRDIWRSGVLASKETPTAIQGRIGGAKGVWYIDPTADLNSDEKWVEIRRSQLKYKYDKTAFSSDEILRTLDICKASHSNFGGVLNSQFIGILSHCGVPTQVFTELLIQDLKAHLGVVNEYLDKPLRLREWIANIGGIYAIRCSGADEYNDSQTGEKNSQEPDCITYDNQGIPTMKEENCVKLLEAGFLPASNRYLHDKLKFVIQKACDKVSEKLHIEIAKSSTLICIADDLGVLEEGEVSIRFGEPFLDEETGRYSFYIQGDVLVARNPAYLPTDIQRVKAVDKKELAHLTDVIVFSTKGNRSKVSLLSGGDYDGDTIWTCWDDRLVNTFRPADIRHVDPPPNFQDEWFEKDERQAVQVARDGMMVNPDTFVSYGIKSSLVPVETGICSHRHRDVVYKHRSYEHPDALTLSWLLSNLVDAAKSGLTIRQSKFGAFLARLGVLPPEYTKPSGERRVIIPTHIMDVLVMGVIPAFRDEVLRKFHQNVRKEHAMPIDPDIFAFYRLVKGKHPALVERLRGELEVVRTQWLKNVGKAMNDRSRQKDDLTCSPSKRARRVSRQGTSDLDDVYREYSNIRVFGGEAGGMDPILELFQGYENQIKAAVAYCLNADKYEDEPSTFAWSCGGYHALCEIKAAGVQRRLGRGEPGRQIVEKMYISLKSNSAFTRAEKAK